VVIVDRQGADEVIASTENTAPPFAVFPDAGVSQRTLSLAASIRTKSGRILCGFWCAEPAVAKSEESKPLNHWWARQDSNLQPDRYEREDIVRFR